MTTWLRKLASLRITPLAMLALAVGIFVSFRGEAPSIAWVIAPMGVLIVNLLCAILVTPRFRRDVGLLMFHICLLAVVALAVYGYLAQFRGRVEIAVGQQLQPEKITTVARGPLHNDDALHELRFVQQSFVVQYASGLFRTRTQSSVRTADGAQWSFGDNVPLHFGGYRFYTSSNKGYSALMRWRGSDGERTIGVINFPSFPFYDWNQLKAWRAPDDTELDLELDPGYKPPQDRAWTLDSSAVTAAKLAVGFAGENRVLQEGETVQLRDGSLTFLGTRMWMGYSVYHFPLLNWMLAFALLGVLALGWFYLRRFSVLEKRAPITVRNAAPLRQNIDIGLH